MERNSIQIGAVVISLAVALTVTLTAVRLTADTSDAAQAAPVFSEAQNGVVTNTSAKGDLAALEAPERILNGATISDCTRQPALTVCKATPHAARLARLP